MNKTKRFFLLGLLTIGSVVATESCKKDDGDNPNGDPFESFDRKAMMRNIGENVAMVTWDSLVQSSAMVRQDAEKLVAGFDAAVVTDMRMHWMQMLRQWKTVEMFQVGALKTSGTLLGRIDIGSLDPLRITAPIDAAKLEQAISSGMVQDDAAFEALSNDTRGIWAIEYLACDVINDDVNTLLRESAARRAFVLGLAKNLEGKFKAVQQDWSSAGSNYIESFSEYNGRDVSSSLTEYVNKWIFQVEMIKNEKVGRPLGKKNNGMKQPDALEARLSNQTFESILNNLNGLMLGFKGANGAGIDDLLNAMDARYGEMLLSEVIERQINECIKLTKTAQAAGKFADVVRNQPELLEAIYEGTKKLTVFSKVDMVNQLGIIITYTDNDGD